MLQFPHPATLKTEQSFTQDVSEWGLRFSTAVKFAIDQTTPLTLQLPFHNAVMHVTGVVVWIREISRLGASQYDVGVRFQWIEDPDRQQLIRHLNTLFRRR